MRKRVKQFEAVLLSVAILFLTFSGKTVRAADTDSQKMTFPVHVIHKTGDDKDNFVIVIMGDGYTVKEQESFLEDATRKAQGMLSWSPYKEFSDRINIYAVQVVSNESGIGVYGEDGPDTYFHVKVYGKAAGFTNGGDEKARALRNELEENYLDAGARVGTIHIISNADGSYGASVNALFSFSARSDENGNGTVMAHEIAHSIGGLGDEYERYTNKANTSDTSDPDKIKWSKLLGFRGVGITTAGTETAFAPSRECMMRWLGQPFCEVCKLELARKLNSTDYISNPKPLYIADPEVSIAHNRTGTLDRDSEKYQITEKNITKANDDDLEFRTVVQNMANKEQHLKMSFRILGADDVVKFEAEKEFTIPAFTNIYDPDAAMQSLSVVIPFVYELKDGDRIDGKIIDMDTQEVLATDKTAEQTWSTVKIHYQCKNADGTESDILDATPAIVYVPEGSSYVLKKPALSGYTFVSSNIEEEKIKITEESTDIIYYYSKNSDFSQDTDQKTAECTVNPVRVMYDAKPHTFDITSGEGVRMRYSMTEDTPYTLTELPSYTDAGSYMIYFEASSDTAKTQYGQAALEITKAHTDLKLTAVENVEGGGRVELQVTRNGILEKEPVTLTCDKLEIPLTKAVEDRWEAVLPNETKIYTFTAHYDGNHNYEESEDSCKVSVTEKTAQSGEVPGGTTGGVTEETPGGTTGGVTEETPGGTTAEIPEEPSKEENNPQTVSGKTFVFKPKVVKNSSKVKNINAAMKKTLTKAGRQAENSSVRIKCKGTKRKKLTLKIDRSTIKFLIKKEIKELQFDSGNLRITMDLRALKEMDKRIHTDLYFEIKKADTRMLSSKAEKIAKKHTIYGFTITGAKKKQISRLKKGKITVEIPDRCLKTETQKKHAAYSVNKKGDLVKIRKSTYDPKKKMIRFTTRKLSQFVTGHDSLKNNS